MRPSRLLLCFLIAATSVACVGEAQPCYRKTREHVWGNIFVKPMTDSTCFGQWYGTLLYYNYKTGDTLFSFPTEPYFPFTHISIASISDVLMFDSMLVVSWMDGVVYRILKVDHHGVVSETPSGLDRIPMLKFGDDFSGSRYRKLNAVNDSIFLISGKGTIYSFLRTFDTVTSVDSMRIKGPWSALDMYGDTIVVVSALDHSAWFYLVDASGKITYSATVAVDTDVNLFSDVYFRYGKLYTEMDHQWRTMLRTSEGFKLAPGTAEDWTLRQTLPLFGKSQVIIVGPMNDEFWVYDQELNLLCNQRPLSSPGAFASGIYRDKVFTANDYSGISTWIPDSTTTSITSPPVVVRPIRIEIWPNPSSCGMITVYSKQSTGAIELCDRTGRVLYRARQSGTGATVISTAFLPTGVYFVNAHTAEGTITERVVLLGAR